MESSQDLLADVLNDPFTKSGEFRLRYRHIHLTYPCHPPATPPNVPDPSWFVTRLRDNLAAKGYTIGELSACCERRTLCRLFTPPRAGVTHVALQIVGKDEVRQFTIMAQDVFRIKECVPVIRVVTQEEHWKSIFAYHRREGGPLIQSGEPRPWAVRGIGPLPKCQYGGNRKKLCDGDVHYECYGCFPRSFASSARAGNIRADKDGNVVSARMVFLNSNQTYRFECTDCGHPFLATPGAITCGGTWCPYCARKALCGCDECNKRALWAHPASTTLVDKERDTRFIPLSSHEVLEFRCRLCTHQYPARVSHVTATDANYCPFCCITGCRVCEDEKCTNCFSRRFMNHPAARFIREPRPEDPPRPYDLKMVMLASHETGFFTCENGHDFDMMFCSVTKNQQWCRHCKNKTEARVYSYLFDQGYQLTRQPTIPNPISGSPLRGDILVTKLDDGKRILVEVDGRQHWSLVERWGGAGGLVIRKARDVYKALFVLGKGVRLVRVHQKDVYKEVFPWRVQLSETIENSSASITYLEALPENDTWKEFREEMLSLGDQTAEKWLETNAHRLVEQDPEEDPVEVVPADPPGSSNEVLPTQQAQGTRQLHTTPPKAQPVQTPTAEKLAAGPGSAAAAKRRSVEESDGDRQEAIELALAQMSITDPVPPRTTKAKPVSRSTPCTCTRTPGPGRRPHDQSCARYPTKTVEALSGAGRDFDELRDMELTIADLEPHQREGWAIHCVSLMTYMKAIPVNCVDQALSILSDDYELPKAFLRVVFMATGQI
jgi:hypothetical protein